jgi:hypothetical protein
VDCAQYRQGAGARAIGHFLAGGGITVATLPPGTAPAIGVATAGLVPVLDTRLPTVQAGAKKRLNTQVRRSKTLFFSWPGQMSGMYENLRRNKKILFS